MKATILPVMILALAVSGATAQTGNDAAFDPTQVTIGMTFDNVRAAWGSPRVMAHPNSDAPEVWYMENGAVIIFAKGKVASLFIPPAE